MSAAGLPSEMLRTRRVVFARWISFVLEPYGIAVADLKELKSGVALIRLLEHVSRKKLKEAYFSEPANREQMRSNIHLFRLFVDGVGMRLPVDEELLAKGDAASTLDLLWALARRLYLLSPNLPQPSDAGTHGVSEQRRQRWDDTAMEELILFHVNSILMRENVEPAEDCCQSWQDGTKIVALVSSLAEEAVVALDDSALGRTCAALFCAENKLKVAAVVNGDECLSGDSQLVMLYLGTLFHSKVAMTKPQGNSIQISRRWQLAAKLVIEREKSLAVAAKLEREQTQNDFVFDMEESEETEILRERVAALEGELHDARAANLSLTAALKRSASEFVVNQALSPPPIGWVTLMFTDVEQSTSLWNLDRHVMDAALRKHNSLIREHITKHEGYEVKTEGDSFMVAFHHTNDAVACAIAVQLALLSADWPSGLTSLKYAQDVMTGDGARYLYHGLRVRIGIHVGTVTTKPDPLSGRMDYFGPMVNRSARVEGLASGGQIVVTDTVISEISDSLPEECGNPVIRELGFVRLKGFQSEVLVHEICPPELQERCYPWPPEIKMTVEAEDLHKANKMLSAQLMDFELANCSFGFAASDLAHKLLTAHHLLTGDGHTNDAERNGQKLQAFIETLNAFLAKHAALRQAAVEREEELVAQIKELRMIAVGKHTSKAADSAALADSLLQQSRDNERDRTAQLETQVSVMKATIANLQISLAEERKKRGRPKGLPRRRKSPSEGDLFAERCRVESHRVEDSRDATSENARWSQQRERVKSMSFGPLQRSRVERALRTELVSRGGMSRQGSLPNLRTGSSPPRSPSKKGARDVFEDTSSKKLLRSRSSSRMSRSPHSSPVHDTGEVRKKRFSTDSAPELAPTNDKSGKVLPKLVDGGSLFESI